MNISLFIDDLDDAPDALKTLYVENPEGGFMLPIAEKLVPERKLTALQKKLDAKDDFVSLDDHQKVLDALELAKTSDDDVETKVSNRVKELQSDWETEKNGLTEKLTSYETKVSQSAIQNALTEAATKAGVRTTAIEDVLLRGGTVFKYVDGNVKAFDTKGEEKFHKGTETYTPSHWVADLKTSATHLFEENVGGGAVGGIKAKPNTSGQKTTSALDMISQGLQETK